MNATCRRVTFTSKQSTKAHSRLWCEQVTEEDGDCDVLMKFCRTCFENEYVGRSSRDEDEYQRETSVETFERQEAEKDAADERDDVNDVEVIDLTS